MSGLAPLALAAGWVPFGAAPSVYVHRGKAYLTGAIQNARGGTGEGAATTTTIGSLPSDATPGYAQTVVLPILPRTTDACNVLLNLDTQYFATIGTDGTVSLDEGIPPSLNEPPSEAEWFYQTGLEPPEGPQETLPQYTVPFVLALALGNAQWVLASALDRPHFASFPILPEFTNDAARIAPHGNRVHLSGGVSANEDGAVSISDELPADTVAALEGEEDFTTALSRGETHPLAVSHARTLLVEQDNPIVPRGDTPPLLRGTHRLKLGVTRLSGGILVEAEAHPKPATVGPGELAQRKFVVGHHHACWEKQAFLTGKGTRCVVVSVHTCPDGPLAPFLTFEIEELLALCVPLPDWFAISLSVDCNEGPNDWQNLSPLISSGCSETPLCGEAACGEFLPCEIHPVSLPTFYNHSAEAVEPTGAGTNAMSGSGFLKPGDELYKGTPHLSVGFPEVDKRLIWHPTQATAITTEFAAQAHVAEISGTMSISPFYERRQFGLHSGDGVSLAHTGWESAGIAIAGATNAIVKLPLR